MKFRNFFELQYGQIWTAVAIFILLILWAQVPYAQDRSSMIKIGDMAPPLALEGILQASVDVGALNENLKDKIVVLEFWATWCGPCRKAIPHLNELVEEFRKKPVQFISVTDEEEWKVKNFLKVTPISGWVGLDRDKSMFKTYGVQLIPQTVIIDQKGRIAAITSPNLLNSQLLEKLLEGITLTPTTDDVKSVGVEKDVKDEVQIEQALLELSIRPAKPSRSMRSSGRAFKARGMTLHKLVSIAFKVSPVRLVASTQLADDTYEVIVNIPNNDRSTLLSLLQQSLKTAFGLKIYRETRKMEVFILNISKDKKTLLRSSEHKNEMPIISDEGQISSQGTSILNFCAVLEGALGKVVLDETNLKGLYNLALYWDPNNPESVISAVQDQLGLELKTKIKSIEVMVFETESLPAKK